MEIDLSVVIITIGRQSLLRAIDSVFKQKFLGNIQVLVVLGTS